MSKYLDYRYSFTTTVIGDGNEYTFVIYGVPEHLFGDHDRAQLRERMIQRGLKTRQKPSTKSQSDARRQETALR